MERTEEIKQKLSEIKCRSLCLDKDDIMFLAIVRNTKTSGDTIGVITLNRDNSSGIVITENGLEWTASFVSSNVIINGKKSSKSRSISYKELAHYEVGYEEGILSNKIQLTRTDLTNPKLLEIGFDIGETDKDQICKIFDLLTHIETVDEIIPDYKRVVYLKAFIIEEDKNPIMRLIHSIISTEFLDYKLPFAKYAKKSFWVFHYKHNLSNIVGWAFALLYRKAYVLGAVFAVLVLIVFFSVSEPWNIAVAVLIMVVQSMFNPYIIYRRYVRILRDCASNKMTEEQTIEVLKKKGGSNGFLAIIAGIIIIISLVSNIISFFTG